MKHILCYGDSNTWGAPPDASGIRFDESRRWTSLLQQQLGLGCRVLEEGCNGRTTVHEDAIEPGRNGIAVLPTILESQRPLDLVVLMLGTNDTKRRFSLTALDISQGIARLIELIQRYPCGKNGKPPQILVVSPIHIGDNIEETFWGEVFGRESIIKSQRLAAHYQMVARQYGCHFLDAAVYAQPSPLDAVHMDKENHAKLAAALCTEIGKIL